MADQNSPNVETTNSTTLSTGQIFTETGYGAPGSTISVNDLFNGTNYNIGTATVAADGTWSVGSQLAPGFNQITATDTRANGKTSTSSPETIYQEASSIFNGPTVQFSSHVTFQKPAGSNSATDAELSLVTSDSNSVSSVAIYSDGNYLGQAHATGTANQWAYTFHKPAGDYNDIQAIATDSFGFSSSLTNSNMELVTGTSSQTQYLTSSDSNSFSQNSYGKAGALLYNESFSTLPDGNLAGLITGDDAKQNYTYDGTEKETITNFHAVGTNHDTLDLKGLGFASVQGVLNHSQNASGNLDIHIGSNQIVLDGVSKSTLQLHHQDILV